MTPNQKPLTKEEAARNHVESTTENINAPRWENRETDFIAGADWQASIPSNDKQGWIDVKERYPTPIDGDRKGNVLGWDNFQNEAHKCQMEDIHKMKMRFTYWQPLPQSPNHH